MRSVNLTPILRVLDLKSAEAKSPVVGFRSLRENREDNTEAIKPSNDDFFVCDVILVISVRSVLSRPAIRFRFGFAIRFLQTIAVVRESQV